MSQNYDNWERIVEAVLRREELRQVALYSSREPSFSSISSSFITGPATPIHDDQNIQLGSSSNTSFQLDKTTGKKCYKIGARELVILEDAIRGRIETQMLSPKTRYAAYLVFKLGKNFRGFLPAKGIIKFVKYDRGYEAEERATTLHLQPVKSKIGKIAVRRSDGWMEVQLGMFYNDLGEDGLVEARLLDKNSTHGIIAEGIEFRPTTNAEIEFVPKKNVGNRRKGIFSILRISGQHGNNFSVHP